MVDFFNENRKRFQEQLIIETAYYHFKYSRDETPYSIVLTYISEQNFDFHRYKEHLRSNDKIILLQPNLCAIVFDGTTEEQGLKASEHLLYHVQDLCFTQHIYMAIVTVNPNNTEFQTVHDLFDLLAYALNHNMDNCIIDSSQIIQHD